MRKRQFVLVSLGISFLLLTATANYSPVMSHPAQAQKLNDNLVQSLARLSEIVLRDGKDKKLDAPTSKLAGLSNNEAIPGKAVVYYNDDTRKRFDAAMVLKVNDVNYVCLMYTRLDDAYLFLLSLPGELKKAYHLTHEPPKEIPFPDAQQAIEKEVDFLLKELDKRSK